MKLIANELWIRGAGEFIKNIRGTVTIVISVWSCSIVLIIGQKVLLFQENAIQAIRRLGEHAAELSPPNP
ncbi:MAG: hypothetical protein WAL71_11655 [Terriglobales bacterium]|jgi:hypothetical protein